MGIIRRIKQIKGVKQFVYRPRIRRIHRKIESAYRKYVHWLSTRGTKSIDSAVNTQADRSEMYIITIAFNTEILIEKQIELIKQHIKDASYHLVVADNSSKTKKRKIIKHICEQNGVEYIGVPRYINRLTWNTLFQPSYSHGAALNWIFYHLLTERRPKRFTILDHDIFPVRDCNLTETLAERDFYGVGRDRLTAWYLWCGWSIFNFDAIIDQQPDFSPIHVNDIYLDTGGANYLQIYRHYDRQTITFPEIKTRRIKKTPSLKLHDDICRADCIQLINRSWIHLINGSNYAHIEGKEDTIEKVLARIHEIQFKNDESY